MQTGNEQNDFCIRFQHRVFKKNNSTSEKGNISEKDLFFSSLLPCTVRVYKFPNTSNTSSNTNTSKYV